MSQTQSLTARAIEPQVRMAARDDAAAMVEVIHAAFGARPPLDPPSTAADETVASVAAAIAACGAVVAEVEGRVAGVIVLAETGPDVVSMRRVSVHPDFQRHGIGTALVEAAEEFAAATGHRRIELGARRELGELIAYWHHRGYEPVEPYADPPTSDSRAGGSWAGGSWAGDASADRAQGGVDDPLIILSRTLPAAVWADTTQEMHALGARLADLLRPGDLVVASGQLGAGKTTLTQGIGVGLGAEGQITSPTFVLSRVHRTPAGRPDLVHVDAYRLSGPDELEDLDLDASLAASVTVVEWGRGVADGMEDHRLEIDILRSDNEDEARLVLVRGIGARWAGVDLFALASPATADAEVVADAEVDTGADAEADGAVRGAR